MLNIIIVGAGGCGREVYEMAKETFSSEEYQIIGFLSDQPDDLDDFHLDVKILGSIKEYNVQENDRFLLAIGDIAGKKKVVTELKNKGAKFLSLIHPAARIFSSAKLGEGVIVYPFVLVSSHAKIGDFCLLNVYSGCGHDAVMGDYSVLCPYAVLLGWTEIGCECFIATHATVAPKKKLGKGTKVSANSAALRDAPEDSFICGVPGKIM